MYIGVNSNKNVVTHLSSMVMLMPVISRYPVKILYLDSAHASYFTKSTFSAHITWIYTYYVYANVALHVI